MLDQPESFGVVIREYSTASNGLKWEEKLASNKQNQLKNNEKHVNTLLTHWFFTLDFILGSQII